MPREAIADGVGVEEAVAEGVEVNETAVGVDDRVNEGVDVLKLGSMYAHETPEVTVLAQPPTIM